MNDENKIDLSIEMYEDLKETLVKAIKNAKTGKTDGSIHSDNAQTERIERLRNFRRDRLHSCSNTCNGIRPCPE